MGAILDRIDDPRDALTRARKWELLAFAKQHGIPEITEGLPAIAMRKILRKHGITNISIPARPLGQPGESIRARDDAQPEAFVPDGNGVEMDAEDDLMRQIGLEDAGSTAPVVDEAPPPAQPEEPKGPGSFTPGKAGNLGEFHALRAECRRLGIPVTKHDNKATLRAKLGKDAAQRGQ